MPVAIANGKRFTFPEGTPPEEMAAAVEEYFSSAPDDVRSPEPSLRDQREDIAGGTLSIGPIDTGIETPQALDEYLSGLGRRMTQIGTLGMKGQDEYADPLLDNSGYATAGAVTGDVAALAALGGVGKAAGALGKGGQMVQRGAQALTAPQKLSTGVAGAAIYGGATTSGGAGDRVEGAAGAALGQGIGQGLFRAAGKVASPKIRDAARQQIAKGGTPTPGEMLGGVTETIEEAARAVPGVGDAINSAKGRSLANWSKSVIDDALEPIGKKTSSTAYGRTALEQADEIIAAQYDEILSGMDVQMDRGFAQTLQKVRQMAAQGMDEQGSRQLDRELQRILNPLLRKENPSRVLLGDTFKEVDSVLRGRYKQFQRSNDPLKADIGDALREVHIAFKDMAKRQHPTKGKALDAADVAYSKLMRAMEAANYAGAQDGVFTPAMLLRSIKKGASTKQYAKGKGFDQGATEAAKEMLAKKIPDSGTATRALTGAGLLGGAAYVSPAAATAAVGGAALYTKPGQALLRALIASRPAGAQGTREMLERLSVPVGSAGMAIGVNAQ